MPTTRRSNTSAARNWDYRFVGCAMPPSPSCVLNADIRGSRMRGIVIVARAVAGSPNNFDYVWRGRRTGSGRVGVRLATGYDRPRVGNAVRQTTFTANSPMCWSDASRGDFRSPQDVKSCASPSWIISEQIWRQPDEGIWEAATLSIPRWPGGVRPRVARAPEAVRHKRQRNDGRRSPRKPRRYLKKVSMSGAAARRLLVDR